MDIKYPESERVRILRGSLSLRAFAEKFGVTGPNIAAIEGDRQGLAVPLAKKMADYYKVSLDWIYGNQPLDSAVISNYVLESDALNLRDIRSSLGLSQEDLALKLGISRQTLISYEGGNIPLFAREKLLKRINEIGNLFKADIKEIIGNKLRELRGHSSKREIYEKLNISLDRYDCLERGTCSITPEEIIEVVEFYNISIDTLFNKEFSVENTSEDIDKNKNDGYERLLVEKDKRITLLEHMLEQQNEIINILKNPIIKNIKREDYEDSLDRTLKHIYENNIYSYYPGVSDFSLDILHKLEDLKLIHEISQGVYEITEKGKEIHKSGGLRAWDNIYGRLS